MPAHAAEGEKESKEEGGKREAPTIDVTTGKRLNEAIEALNAQKYDEAKAALSKMNMEKLSPYEKSRVYQIYASIAGAQNDYDGVRKNMQLAISSGGLNDEEQQEARYQIAQMFIAQERWQDGINALNEWFTTAVNPNSTAYYLLAVAYYQLKKVDQALVPAQKAVDLAENPRDSWIQLLLALRIDKEQYAEAVPLLKRLVASDPGKKNYWIQLSGVNRQLERYDDSLAAMELANTAGLLTSRIGAAATGRSRSVRRNPVPICDAARALHCEGRDQAGRKGLRTPRLFMDPGARLRESHCAAAEGR